MDNLEENQTMTSTDLNSDPRKTIFTGLFLLTALILIGVIISQAKKPEYYNPGYEALFNAKGIILVRSDPEIITWDGYNLWVTRTNWPATSRDKRTTTLLKIDPIEGQVTGEVEIGFRPSDIVWDGSQLWVSYFIDGTIMRISPDPLGIINTYQVCSGPKELAWDGNNLWIICWNNQMVQRVDVNSGKITLEIETDKDPIDISRGKDSVWILIYHWNYPHELTNHFYSIVQIDSVSGKIMKEFTVEKYPGSNLASLSWDGNNIWVARKDIAVKLDPETGSVIDEIVYDGLPGQMTWDGVNLWLFNRRSKSILQIDPIQAEILASYPTSADDVSFTVDGLNLWVNDAYMLQRYTPSKVKLYGMPADIAWADGQIWIVYGLYDDYGSIQSFNPDTHLFGPATKILDNPTALIYDGNYFWVTDWEESVLQQISLYENKVIKQIDVGDKPVNLSWDGTHLWVVNSWGGSISKINISSGEALSEIKTGKYARGIAWDGEYLWVIASQSKLVRKINPNTNQIENSYPLDWEAEHLVWVGDSIWADGFQRYDSKSGAKLDYVDLYCGPDDLVWDGEFLWAACDGKNVVLKLDAHTGECLAMWSVESPLRLLINDDQIWVASRDSIQQMDIQSLEYLTSLWQ